MSTAFDFYQDRAARLEAVYLTPDVVEQRCRTLRALNPRPAERVLDIGSGPGLLAHDIAASVGAEGAVVGVDLSEAMLEMSRSRCQALPWARFEHGDATALRFDAQSFDAAVCTQVYEYVEDVPSALAQLYRVLRPGGRVVIIDSPVYRRSEHGERMREERHRDFEARYGFRSDSIPSIEYLDEQMLADWSRDLNIRWEIHRLWYGWRWALRPLRARLAGRRPPSRFWILVGTWGTP